jgi:hypothetical protein
MARYSKAYRSREEGTTSVARVYADINDKRPAEYWDYENLQVQVSCRAKSLLTATAAAVVTRSQTERLTLCPLLLLLFLPPFSSSF